MKLYYAETLSPRKACAVARYLGSPVEYVHVDLAKGEHREPAYLAINPNGKVPALTDGDRRWWEANAIMCYLADKAGSDLWPRDGRQIEIVRWFSWDADHFSRHAGALYFEHLIKARFGLGDPDPAATEEALGYFRTYARVLSDHLKGRRYVVGDGLTVADFAVAVTLPYADQVGIPLDEFPEIRRWHDRLSELEAWREPFPATAPAAA
jgi:glutathione S-transferase